MVRRQGERRGRRGARARGSCGTKRRERRVRDIGDGKQGGKRGCQGGPGALRYVDAEARGSITRVVHTVLRLEEKLRTESSDCS